MRRGWRSLRVQLATFGFLAIYLPLLLVVAVSVAVESEVTVEGSAVAEEADSRRSPWVTTTVLLLGPVAAASAWWLAGRAVGPIDRIRRVAEDIEGTDLTRRIDLDQGPTEIVALAAAFDGMLARLQRAADTQRQLIEETSHELRTPLAVLTTNAEVVLAHPQPTVDTYRERLERTRAAAVAMQATIDALLVDARGRARTLVRRPADLAVLARDVVHQTRSLAASHGVVVSVDAPDAVTCAVDEPTVRRAIGNLVDNAVRCAPHGSAVAVTVTGTDAVARIEVTDHGPGIPVADQPHVFERYWTRGHDGAGTGLGLPIADQIARAHGGRLIVTSPGATGDGCTFVLTLPRSHAPGG